MTDPIPRDLEQLVATLRTPVAVDPALKGQILTAARMHGVPRRSRPSRAVLFAGAGALAAVLAGVLFLPSLRWGRHDASRLVPFVVTAPNAARVTVVGDFNDWDPHATPLSRLDGNAWWVVVKLPPGRYRYSFVLDGTRWIVDPSAPRAGDDDFGPRSSVVTILGPRT
jgi:hypothetical protein